MNKNRCYSHRIQLENGISPEGKIMSMFLRKSKLSVVIVICFLSLWGCSSNPAAPRTGSAIPTNGLVAYYPFNGNANDESGNGNNGVVYGATLTGDRFGRQNSAFLFNGTSDDYIDLGTWNPITSNNYTLSAWIKVDDPSTNSFDGWYCGYILAKGNDNQQNSYGIEIGSTLQYSDGSIGNTTVGSMTNVIGPGSAVWATSPKGILTAEQWHFVTSSLNNQDLRVYVDGQPLNSSIVTGTLSITTASLWIGGQNRSVYNFWFKGSIDDVRIYNRALSPTEIQSLYDEGGWTGN
jgi:hypothetical protein